MQIQTLLTSLLIGSAVMFGGCASFQGFPKPPNTSAAVAPAPGYQLGDSGILKYNSEQDLTTKQLIRNDIIDARMAEIDRNFADFERALYIEGVGSGVGTDWVLLALTSASTLSTVTHTKTIYSALSTAVAGGNAAFDKRVLFDKTLPALLAQMTAQRETVRLSIRTNELLPIQAYSLFAAQSDLETYAFAGSIAGAIASVAEDAGKKSSTAKQEQKDLTKAVFQRTASSTRLHEFWKPKGVIDQNTESRLKTWLSNNGFDSGNGAITMFIFDRDKEDSRLKAMKDLGL